MVLESVSCEWSRLQLIDKRQLGPILKNVQSIPADCLQSIPIRLNLVFVNDLISAPDESLEIARRCAK